MPALAIFSLKTVREAWEEDDPTRRPSAISVLAKRPFGGGHPRVANASRGESR